MDPKKKYWHDEIGYNYRMTNLQAAIGCAQLERIEEILELNSKTEKKYRQILADRKEIEWQKHIQGKDKVTWLICGTVNIDRDKLIEKLRVKGIDSRPFFISLSDMPIYKNYSFSNKISRLISSKGINLPVKLNDSIEDKLKIINNVLLEYS
jgi:perosamine synthetase